MIRGNQKERHPDRIPINGRYGREKGEKEVEYEFYRKFKGVARKEQYDPGTVG